MRHSLFLVAIIVLMSALTTTVKAQKFENQLFINHGDTLPFRVLYPLEFDRKKSYPVVFFLHGAGERGRDNQKQLVHGSTFFSDDATMKTYPAVVIFPQCPEGDYWAKVQFTYDTLGKRTFHFRPDLGPTKAMKLLSALIDSIHNQGFTSKDQFYLGGLSMGGMGTFELLFRKPDIFAAAFPICGGGDTATCKTFARHLPLWIFHGEVDDVVPVDFSKEMANAIQRHGGNPKLTIYPGVNHNAWDFAFKEKDLLPWLFSKRN